MKVLLIGSGGQLGWELCRTCPPSINFVPLDYPEIDLSDGMHVDRLVSEIQPDWVINAAAYTAVAKPNPSWKKPGPSMVQVLVRWHLPSPGYKASLFRSPLILFLMENTEVPTHPMPSVPPWESMAKQNERVSWRHWRRYRGGYCFSERPGSIRLTEQILSKQCCD